MYVYHFTIIERLEEILKNGLQPGMPINLTNYAGAESFSFYEEKKNPIYLSIKNEDTHGFKKENEVLIKINKEYLDKNHIYPDIQSLIDIGIKIDKEGETFYFQGIGQSLNYLPNSLEPKEFKRNNTYYIEDLMTPNSKMANYFISLTGTFAYTKEISPDIISSEIYNEYQKAEYLGNCIESFDEEGNSLIDIFNHTSDFALSDENSIEMTYEEFIKKTRTEDFILNKLLSNIDYYDDLEKCIFLNDQEREIAYMYEPNNDIHFIFKLSKYDINPSNENKKCLTLKPNL